jgi:gliding motility-associated protein GldC
MNPKDRETEITFKVALDENHIPSRIEWHANDTNDSGPCDAAFLTIWDPREKNTLRIDLWTKDMMVDDMQIFFHQMMLSMSDTYLRATGDQKISDDMKTFALNMGEKMGILKKGS